jgi:transposase InsO family protein
VRKILRKNPAYGYRRLLKALRREGIKINHKTLKKLLKASKINLKRRIKHRRRSAVEVILDELGEKVNLIRRLTEVRLFQIICTDFTRIVFARGRRYSWLIAYLEVVSKKVLSYEVGPATTAQALIAYRRARRFLKRKGVKFDRVYVHQDQGVQFTAYDYIGQLANDRLNISFSRKGRFEDNPDMEAFNGRFKDEWKDELYEAGTAREMKKIVARAISYYNKRRIHLALGDCSPDEFIARQESEAKNTLKKR